MKVLLFGGSGSAGGSVLRRCLIDARVSEVRAVARRPLSFGGAKLRLVIHHKFDDYTAIASSFDGVDACFYCLGKSVRQVSGEAEYRRITRDYAVAAARMLQARRPQAAFHFISGASTSIDSRFMWARVKAETEQEVMAIAGAVCFRPASIDGEPSASEPRLYKVFRPLARLMKPLRSLYITGDDIGLAMIKAAELGWRRRIVENREMRDLAERR